MQETIKKDAIKWCKSLFTKKWWTELARDFLKKHSNACLFWNGLVFLFFFVLLCIDWYIAVCLFFGLGSLFTLALWFDGNDEDCNNNLWIVLTGTFWAAIGLMLLIGAVYLLISCTIIPFNDWLNSKRKNSNNEI